MDYIFADREKQQRLERQAKYATSGGAQCHRAARLIELFEIAHPLILAPMAGLGTVGLAAEVCEAGGLGSIGCATMQPQLVAKTIQELRGLTS